MTFIWMMESVINRCSFHQSTQHHLVVRWKACEKKGEPPVNTDRKLLRKKMWLRAQSQILCATSEHSATWWSDGKLVRREIGLRAMGRTLWKILHSFFNHRASVSVVVWNVFLPQIVGRWCDCSWDCWNLFSAFVFKKECAQNVCLCVCAHN